MRATNGAPNHGQLSRKKRPSLATQSTRRHRFTNVIGTSALPPLATEERTWKIGTDGPQGDMALPRLYKHQPRLGSLFRHPPPLPHLDHNPAAYPSLDDASASLYDTRQIDLAGYRGELAGAEIGCQSLPRHSPPFQRTHHGVNADE